MVAIVLRILVYTCAWFAIETCKIVYNGQGCSEEEIRCIFDDN